MSYDQGGASFPFSGKKTKTALKQAIKTEPEAVRLWTTSMFGGFDGKATDLPVSSIFNVAGPDPLTKRDWYATIQWKNGKLVCS